MVRGQDGYGSVDRTSRVVGFKTTNQIDKILGSYKHKRILVEQKRFGYSLVIYKIIAKKGTSFYAKNFTVSEEAGGSFILGKQFPESISCDYSLNGERQSGILFAKTNDANMADDSLKQAAVSGNAGVSLVSDTLIIDSSKIRVGINRAIFSCMMPDADTIVQYRDFFVPSDRAELLSSLRMGRTFQEWGSPQVNESVEHHQITLDGEPFRFGIGSHANSDIEYILPRPFDVFHAVIGLDDESSCGDGAHFVVQGNDTLELFRSRRLYSLEKQAINVDVRGVKKLNLRIEMGDNKDCDHGDWANAWLEAR